MNDCNLKLHIYFKVSSFKYMKKTIKADTQIMLLVNILNLREFIDIKIWGIGQRYVFITKWPKTSKH